MTPSTRPTPPWWVSLLLAFAAGPVMDAGFPGQSWWPLTFLGTAMMLVALMGRRVRGSLVTGFVGGMSFYLFQIQWTALYLGPIPWVALSFLEALIFMVGAALIALAYRFAAAAWPGIVGRIGVVPVVIAGLWTAREAFASVWPYGGFAWGRLGESQSLSPFAALAAWFGISGLTFIMVLLVAVILECALEARARASVRAVVAIASVFVVLAIPAWPTPTHGTVRVAAVQGNGPAGYFEYSQPGDVLNAQASATLPLIKDKGIDMLVWPEDGSDLDPTRVPAAAKVLNYFSRKMKAPLITGTITHRRGKYYNTSLLWEAGDGAVDYYDKKHPVPFGEYVPDRAFWEPFAPSLIGLIQRGYTPGTRNNIFDVHGVRAGVSICFDIADDQLITDMMHGGAQIILAQTNNADFGRTEENVQQLAIARLRAIETGRGLVNISTVGTSQVIAPNGRTIASIPAYRPGAIVTDVPLGTTTTPATLFSRAIEWLVVGLGLGGLANAVFCARRERRLNV